MSTTVHDQVRNIIDHNKKTPQQRDQEHAAWLETPESIIDIMDNPYLGIRPSLRTVDDNRDILMQQLRLMKWAKHAG